MYSSQRYKHRSTINFVLSAYDFVVDEVHFSGTARSAAYLAANSGNPITTSQGTYSANDGTWDVGALDAGSNATLEITVNINTDTEGSIITNIATVTISTLGALIFIDLLGPSGDLVSVLVFTPFLLILGEVVPKSVFQQKADDIVSRIIYGLRFFSYVFYPVIFVFSRIARFAVLSLQKLASAMCAILRQKLTSPP